MNTTSHTPSGGGFSHSREPGTAARPVPAGPLRIRTGRTVLAAVGLIALLVVPVGAVLALFTAVSWLLPVAGLAAAAAAVAGLRSLALRDRRRRMENAFRAAMGPLPQSRTAGNTVPEAAAAVIPAEPREEAEPRKETVLFDRESAASPTSDAASSSALESDAALESNAAPESDAALESDAAPAAAGPAPFTAEELRAEALKVAAAAQPAKPGTTPWQPVEVPKPVYVDAPKAERPAPEPLVLPEPPRPLTKTPLRPGAVPAPAQERPDTGKINLDDVLQRRRA